MRSNKTLSAFLNADAEFEGNLVFSGTLEINGTFRGEISASGMLVAGEDANIEADIHVDTIVLNGKVVGNIKAEKRIEILNQGVVYGNIEAPTIIIRKGAVFEGQCLTQQVTTHQKDDIKMLSGSSVRKLTEL